MSSIVYSHRIFSLQQRGGISRYFCELASRVNRQPGFACRVIAPLHFNEHLLDCDAPRRAHYVPLRGRTGRLYRAANGLLAPVLTRAAGPDIVHHTYYAPADLGVAKLNVVTVYDMIHELYADEFSPVDPTSEHKRRCVERADHVICISRSTAADLMRLFGTPAEKISVTHLAHSSVFDRPPAASVLDAATRPFLLYVGQRRGYKGFDDALRAYAASPRLRSAFDFVAFGGPAFSADEQATLQSLPLRGDAVRRLEGDDRMLAAAYRSAHAFVYPSRYEGFGIPPLEAMASGCPVVCAATSSLPEVVGDAAQCFDPERPGSLGAAIEALCFDDSRRAELVRRGLERAGAFSWERCADETAAVYQRVLAA